MSDELLSPSGGNEPVDESSSATPEVPTEIARLSRENQKWRTQTRELQAQLKELAPLAEQFKASQESQKTETQKLAEAVTAAERKAAEKDAALERAINEAKLTKLAVKANINLDVLELIDINKLDLSDEEGTLKKLNVLATARTTANGASNPARNGATGMTDKELRDTYFNGGGPRSKTMIFGGN